MDASTLMTKMNAHFSSLLEQFYDEMLNKTLKKIADGNPNMSIEKLQEQTMSLKADILNFTPMQNNPYFEQKPKKEKPTKQSASEKKEPEKTALDTNTIPSKGELEALPRKEVQALAKSFNIPARAKTSELISALIKLKPSQNVDYKSDDEFFKDDPEPVEPEPEINSVVDEEPQDDDDLEDIESYGNAQDEDELIEEEYLDDDEE